jgi:hypothetical protein
MFHFVLRSTPSALLCLILFSFSKTHLLTEELGAELPVRFMDVSICPTMAGCQQSHGGDSEKFSFFGAFRRKPKTTIF